MARRKLIAEFSLRVLLFFTAAGLSKQVSVSGGLSCWADIPGCGPDADEGRAVAKAEQDTDFTSTEQPHTADMCIQGEHRQDATCLQVPQAQLSWIIMAT